MARMDTYDPVTRGPDRLDEPGAGAPAPGKARGRNKHERRIGNVPLRLILTAVPVLAFVLLAAFGPLVFEYDAVTTRTGERLLPPGSVLSDGQRAWLGTDQVGRDLFAQVIQGARVSMLVGALTVVIAAIAGAAIGVVAGYFGGWIDSLTMRVADVQLAFPPILLAIFIAATLGPSIMNVIITLSITRWVMFARVARGSTLAVKHREFVDAARVLGATHRRIIIKEILPAMVTPLMIVATVQFGLVVISEAALSFLGLGTPASLPSWGLTIANGRDHLATAWWIATMPGIALALLMVAVGRFGDELRDHLDPRMRSSR